MRQLVTNLYGEVMMVQSALQSNLLSSITRKKDTKGKLLVITLTILMLMYLSLHTESGVVSMLFMLLMWDVIFAPMPGVFETPYQSAPMDLWTDAFYVGRQSTWLRRYFAIANNEH